MAEENQTLWARGTALKDYQMNRKMGTIFMLISATGMGLVPLFSRWGTRTDMFDATQGSERLRLHRRNYGAWPHGHGCGVLRDSDGCHP